MVWDPKHFRTHNMNYKGIIMFDKIWVYYLSEIKIMLTEGLDALACGLCALKPNGPLQALPLQWRQSRPDGHMNTKYSTGHEY